MRKLALVSLVSLLAICQSAQAGIFKQVKQIINTSLSAVKVDSPAAKRLGLDLNGNRMSVISAVPFYGRVYVYDEEVAIISPGESLEGLIGQKLLFLKWEPLDPQIPILVKFYFDTEDMSRGKPIGFAHKILNFRSQNPRSQTWIIRTSDIVGPDGNRLKSSQTPIFPLAHANTWTLEMDYPREDWNATAVIQVANNTHFNLSIALNGKFREEIKPGEIYFLRGQEILGSGQQASMQFTFSSKGFIMGTAERQFRIPGKGVHAYQFVMSPSDIRR